MYKNFYIHYQFLFAPFLLDREWNVCHQASSSPVSWVHTSPTQYAVCDLTTCASTPQWFLYMHGYAQVVVQREDLQHYVKALYDSHSSLPRTTWPKVRPQIDDFCCLGIYDDLSTKVEKWHVLSWKLWCLHSLNHVICDERFRYVKNLRCQCKSKIYVYSRAHLRLLTWRVHNQLTTQMERIFLAHSSKRNLSFRSPKELSTRATVGQNLPRCKSHGAGKAASSRE